MTANLRATLRDPDLQAKLERDGFVVVRFLDNSAVQRLSDAFDALGPAPGDPHMACHSSFQSYDPGYKRAVSQTIRSVLGPPLEGVLDRQRMLPASFIAKWPGDRSGFGLHQDLSLVDEREFTSVVVWVALDDTSPENGQLWVAPGSHRWLHNPRGIQAFEFPYTEVAQRVVERHSVPLEVSRGEAVIFNNALLHFSPPSRATTSRRVALTQVIPEEVPNLHYFGDGRGAVDVYEIRDESFWIDNNPFVLWEPPPSIDWVGSFRAKRQQLTEEMLDELVARGDAWETHRPSPGPINTDYPWCHRCGTTDMDAPERDPWVGNVTLLCTACAAREHRQAGVRRDAGSLQDAEHRMRLDAEGFVTVPLLEDPMVDRLRAVYDDIGIDPAHGVIATSNDLEPRVADRVDRSIRDIMRPVLRDLLPGYEIFLAAFVSKGAHVGEGHPFHQDLTFTDERTDRAILVWVPLVDVDAGNGALRMVPGSHLWADGIRPGMRSGLPTAPFQAELAERATCISLAAGTAVVYDPALIHGSGTNPTGRVRVALALALARRGARLVHFAAPEEGTVAGFEVDDRFYVEHTAYDVPAGCPPHEAWTAPVTPGDLALHLEPTPARQDPAASGPPYGGLRVAMRRRLPRFEVTLGRSLLPAPPGSVLVDSDADRHLRRDGFTRLPLLDRATVEVLRNLYGRMHGWTGSGFEPDLVNPDTLYRRESSAHLSRLLDERVGAMFVDHDPYLRNYLCKWPGENSELNLHRDWMYVDERSGDRSYVVWIPLVDVTDANGPLHVLRHSHRVDPMLRGTHLNAEWVEDETHVRPRLLTVTARAGDAVILDNQLVHCSSPNRSSDPRLVAAVGMRRRGTPLVYFRRVDDDTAARYDVNEEFFLTHTPQGLMEEPPDLPVAAVVPIGDAHLDGAHVVERLKTSLLTRIDDGHRRLASARKLLRPHG